MTLTVTVNKNDLVEGVRKDPPGRVWRFKRFTPFTQNHKRKLTMEQEQEICAMYVDQPNLSVRKIADAFGVNGSALDNIIRAYRLPHRNTGKSPSVSASLAPKPSLRDLLMGPPIPDPRPVWRVTVVRTVIEEIRAETLLDIAAHYDGTDAKITKVELA